MTLTLARRQALVRPVKERNSALALITALLQWGEEAHRVQLLRHSQVGSQVLMLEGARTCYKLFLTLGRQKNWLRDSLAVRSSTASNWQLK